MHKGTPHEGLIPHSGRYEWGSGKNSFQRLDDKFTQEVRKLRKAGYSDEEIAKGFGFSSVKELNQKEATAKVFAMKQADKSLKEISEATGLSIEAIRTKLSIASDYERDSLRKQAQELAAKGIGATEGARIMGLINAKGEPKESSFRSLLDESIAERKSISANVAAILKEEVAKNKYIDIGKQTWEYLGCNETQFKKAVQMLEEEGYERHSIWKKQMGIKDQYTNTNTLAPPNTTKQEIYDNYDKIVPISGVTKNFDKDNKLTSLGLEPFTDVKSKRVEIRYAEDGGEGKDGVMEIRPGVADLSLGRAHYAQVRISVDGTHYLKGMAIYGDPKDFPPGKDIIFNTNKKKGTPMLSDDPDAKQVLKVQKKDEANPFGTTIRRTEDLVLAQKKGSAINIVNEEGDWESWSKTLASQFLSKQPTELARKQLDVTFANKLAELDDIRKITNPTLKKQMLEDFAGDCDSSAVHLKATHLPGQATKALLPVPSMPQGQIYAPHLPNGERVVLVRYPHGGRFEIPELVVNNNHLPAKKMLGNPQDAVGINLTTAQQLSGADFDGDTALVIPVTRNGRRTVDIRTEKPLPGLVGFDTSQYDLPSAAPKLKGVTKQRKMGEVTNLITDMTIKGAGQDELERAVRHSQVVIDAQKHRLDYKKSYKDENIEELKRIYQNVYDPETGKKIKGGVGTIISSAKSEERVPKRYDTRHINPETGEKIYKITAKPYLDKKTGEMVLPKTMKSTKMAEAKDAMELVSEKRMPMEIVYAKYANKLKALANETRKEAFAVKEVEVDKAMRIKYAKEIESLKDKLTKARLNAPKERLATRLANYEYEQRVKDIDQDSDEFDKDQLKKIRGQALAGARARVGAKKYKITFTDREWEAIQSKAIPKTTLRDLFKEADPDHLRKMATPKTASKITPGMVARIKSMANNPAYTLDDISKMLGISVSTVSKYSK